MPWSLAPSHPVLALAAADDIVYVAGGFTNVNDMAANGLVALHADSGDLLDSWEFRAANRTEPAVIRSLRVSDGKLFIGGGFTSLGDLTVRMLGAVNPTNGIPTAFDAKISGGSSGVSVIERSGDFLYIAGDFTSVGGQARPRLAAVSALNGQVVAWNPAPNRGVASLSVMGNRLYVGGEFTTISGITLRNIAVYEIPAHTLLPWDAALSTSSSGIYFLLALDTVVYCAGNFDSIGGEFRTRTAALGPGTAQSFEWDPTPSNVPSVIAASDRVVCFGGSFRTMGKSGNVFPVGYLAVFSREPTIHTSQLADGKLILETSTGDRTRALLQRSTDLKTWNNALVNDAPGYIWKVERSVDLAPYEFYRVIAE